MRDEKTVVKQIIDFAQTDDDIRAVVMNGSRVNSNAPVDPFQDYDVIFFVKDLPSETHKTDQSWADTFGDLVICQQNDFENGYIFLMQFFDGVRLDASFRSIDTVKDAINADSLSKVLLDKDNIIGTIPAPGEASYWVKKPTEKEWDQSLNELFWIQPYVIKAVYRNEEAMAHYMYHNIFLQQMQKLVSWFVSIDKNWQVNIGAYNKWLNKYLESTMAESFFSLFKINTLNQYIQKMSDARALIRHLGVSLGKKLGYTYPCKFDENVCQFMDTFADIYNVKSIAP